MKKEILEILIDSRDGGRKTIPTMNGMKTIITEFIPEEATDKILELFKERIEGILNHDLSWHEYLARKDFKDFDKINKLKGKEIKKILKDL